MSEMNNRSVGPIRQIKDLPKKGGVFSVPEPLVKKEEFEVDDITEWNAAADAPTSRFENRVPQSVKRTVITVNERKMVFERSGKLFKLMGHMSDLIVLMFTAVLISSAVGAVFFAGVLTGAIKL